MQIDAHHAGRGVVIPYRDKSASDPGASDVERGEQRENRESEAEMGKCSVAVETHAQYLRTLYRNAASAIRERPRFQDDGIDDERKRKRGYCQVKAFETQRWRADDEACKRRYNTCREGSTRLARRAGSHEANSATNKRTRDTPTNVSGSVGLIS